ncbi:uncharacterized protein SPPG_04861 [Spizellomyces punctatus DAOM BR117]|uniref:Uncharacterized protein n=1 Tax=Spizellomyces punctatus (strain DAOM BR117) TaxID=645134 RepID=A0A0L0HHF8_SPIPD|nr:uncharacterized protein SPPG_04861 [Spizellomyces punctatus DAOM BR117]KND00553.1 hypothetical protein SPPG_04861 [Spizellomyces punctatus DAOM BR117]|eukprot:XP_016608592.1 hypothetical protein SPPG_04861 [Spizellomyces punctatus DAOM BR117]
MFDSGNYGSSNPSTDSTTSSSSSTWTQDPASMGIIIGVIGVICLLGIALLIWSCYRYRRAKLPTYEDAVSRGPNRNVVLEPLPPYEKDDEVDEIRCDTTSDMNETAPGEGNDEQEEDLPPAIYSPAETLPVEIVVRG